MGELCFIIYLRGGYYPALEIQPTPLPTPTRNTGQHCWEIRERQTLSQDNKPKPHETTTFSARETGRYQMRSRINNLKGLIK